MTQRFDICIRGSGIVGSTLALLLAQQRLRVALVGAPGPAGDATVPGHSDVRAYALNAASRRLLESVRAWPEGASESAPQSATEASDVHPVTPVRRMEVQGDAGGALSFSAEDAGEAALNWIVDVPPLEARLAQALQFQSHVHRLSAHEPAPAADLTVVCEGRRSRARAEWGIEFDTQPYPHHALAARLQLPAPHEGVARQWFQAGEILALLPLGGSAGRSAALVWSVPAEKAAHLLTLDSQALLAEVASVCGMPTDGLQLTHAAQSWPLELSQATRWVMPGLALAGDAAHAMHPLAGQGLNVGLGDVAELAHLLQSREYWRSPGDLKLLRRYERARKTDFAAMGGLTNGLFKLFQPHSSAVQNLRNWGLSGVDRLAPLKNWLTRQAMGVS